MFLKTSLNRLRGRSLLDARSTAVEPLFLAPPFTPAMVDAIRLVSTRLPLKADEPSRQLWQSEANAACAAEYDALLPLFTAMPTPPRVLEIGPGFGRSVVYFRKRGLWPNAALSLYDADGDTTRYKQKYYDHPPQWPDTSSFCGDLALLRSTLAYNGILDYQLHDARTLPLAALPGPYDLIYGFYSIGFHWSLEHYLADLEPLMHDKSLLVCTLNKNFQPFPQLAHYHTRTLACRDIKKKSSPLQLLVLSKSPLP